MRGVGAGCSINKNMDFYTGRFIIADQHYTVALALQGALHYIINPTLVSVDCFWVSRGKGAQLHRYWHWSIRWSQWLHLWKNRVGTIKYTHPVSKMSHSCPHCLLLIMFHLLCSLYFQRCTHRIGLSRGSLCWKQSTKCSGHSWRQGFWQLQPLLNLK